MLENLFPVTSAVNGLFIYLRMFMAHLTALFLTSRIENGWSLGKKNN